MSLLNYCTDTFSVLRSRKSYIKCHTHTLHISHICITPTKSWPFLSWSVIKYLQNGRADFHENCGNTCSTCSTCSMAYFSFVCVRVRARAHACVWVCLCVYEYHDQLKVHWRLWILCLISCSKSSGSCSEELVAALPTFNSDESAMDNINMLFFLA